MRTTAQTSATATWVAARRLRAHPWRVASTLVLFSGPAALRQRSPESVASLWIVVGVTLAFGTVAAMVERRAELEEQRRHGWTRLATIGHLLVEAGVLAFVGGMVGAAVAWCTMPAGTAIASDLENVPISLAVALAAVAAPAWWASRRRSRPRDIPVKTAAATGTTTADAANADAANANANATAGAGKFGRRTGTIRDRSRVAVARMMSTPARALPAAAAVAMATAMSVVDLASPGGGPNGPGGPVGPGGPGGPNGPSGPVWIAIVLVCLAVVVEYGWRTATDRRAETVALVRRGLRYGQTVAMFGREAAFVGAAGSIVGGLAGLVWADVDNPAGRTSLSFAPNGVVAVIVAMSAIALTIAFSVASAAIRGAVEPAIGPGRMWTVGLRSRPPASPSTRGPANRSARRSSSRPARRPAVRTIAPDRSACGDLVSSDVHCGFNSVL